jgi:hypothetical protein
MARPPTPAPLNLGLQAAALKRDYPEGDTVLSRGQLLTWKGSLRPTEVSADYEVLLAYQPRLCHDPFVYVVSPRLRAWRGDPLPHVYQHNRLCLYLDDEWTPTKPLADTFLPWAANWLFFYEVWVATGDWLGEGEHPGSRSRSNRATRRDRQRAVPAHGRPLQHDAAFDHYLTLLHDGIRQAYGPDADLQELLVNLSPPAS